MPSRVILIGGIYGSGKSTLGKSLEREYRVIDYDHITGDVKGSGVVKTSEAMASIRHETWGHLFLNALVDSAKLYPLTVGLGTFSTRERRDRYYDTLSRVAQVIGLYYMLPMRETISRIREDRPNGSKLVNASTVLGFYRIHNQSFVQQDNCDLEISANIPVEYRALLQKSGYQPNPLTQRWKVISQSLSSTDIHTYFDTENEQ